MLNEASPEGLRSTPPIPLTIVHRYVIVDASLLIERLYGERAGPPTGVRSALRRCALCICRRSVSSVAY